MKLKVKQGKGVLGKDGQPFAPRTLHAVRGEWNLPMPYSAEALLSCIMDEKITEIQLITESNVEYTIKIDRNK